MSKRKDGLELDGNGLSRRAFTFGAAGLAVAPVVSSIMPASVEAEQPTIESSDSQNPDDEPILFSCRFC